MARRSYSRDDVETHSDGFYGPSYPAVNVKVYRTIQDAWQDFAKDEDPDPRFTLDWIEEHVSDESLDAIFWDTCRNEFEYLESWATGAEGDSLFPDDDVELTTAGRSGGWVVVRGLPDVDDWDAVRLARWRKFERVAKSIADYVPVNMLGTIYVNEFELWADEQAEESPANSELPVDEALATL